LLQALDSYRTRMKNGASTIEELSFY